MWGEIAQRAAIGLRECPDKERLDLVVDEVFFMAFAKKRRGDAMEATAAKLG
ncbi:MAG: hypothetical protein RIT81_11570 [Deltaproteobacteria bacterium]